MTDQDKQLQDKRTYQKERKARLIDEGNCKECGKPRGEGSTRTMCKACAKTVREHGRRRNGTPLDAPVQKQFHRRQTDLVLGSLTRADVRRAVTTLPLKPPGK